MHRVPHARKKKLLTRKREVSKTHFFDQQRVWQQFNKTDKKRQSKCS